MVNFLEQLRLDVTFILQNISLKLEFSFDNENFVLVSFLFTFPFHSILKVICNLKIKQELFLPIRRLKRDQELKSCLNSEKRLLWESSKKSVECGGPRAISRGCNILCARFRGGGLFVCTRFRGLFLKFQNSPSRASRADLFFTLPNNLTDMCRILYFGVKYQQTSFNVKDKGIL